MKHVLKFFMLFRHVTLKCEQLQTINKSISFPFQNRFKTSSSFSKSKNQPKTFEISSQNHIMAHFFDYNVGKTKGKKVSTNNPSFIFSVVTLLLRHVGKIMLTTFDDLVRKFKKIRNFGKNHQIPHQIVIFNQKSFEFVVFSMSYRECVMRNIRIRK